MKVVTWYFINNVNTNQKIQREGNKNDAKVYGVGPDVNRGDWQRLLIWGRREWGMLSVETMVAAYQNELRGVEMCCLAFSECFIRSYLATYCTQLVTIGHAVLIGRVNNTKLSFDKCDHNKYLIY